MNPGRILAKRVVTPRLFLATVFLLAPLTWVRTQRTEPRMPRGIVFDVLFTSLSPVYVSTQTCSLIR